MIVTFVGHHGHDAENALSYDMKAAFDALKQALLWAEAFLKFDKVRQEIMPAKILVMQTLRG